MKYLVEVEEWENLKKLHHSLGTRETLNFIEEALKDACWGEGEEMEDRKRGKKMWCIVCNFLWRRNHLIEGYYCPCCGDDVTL